jgi:hypothetical protein
MSFSLWTVFAVALKQSPIPLSGTGRLLFLQTTDELGAQVALLQSLVSPVVRAAHHNIQTVSSTKIWIAPRSDFSTR